jgi:hypothetical protein
MEFSKVPALGAQQRQNRASKRVRISRPKIIADLVDIDLKI